MKLFDFLSFKKKEVKFTTETMRQMYLVGFGSVNPIWLKANNYTLVSIFNEVAEIFGIIDTLADLASDIPLKTYKNDKEFNSYESELVKNPNNSTNEKEFLYLNYLYYLILGNSYINKLSNNSTKYQELWTLPAQNIEIKTLYPLNSDIRINKISEYRNISGSQQSFTPEQIIHFKRANINFDQGNYTWFYGFPKLAGAIMAATSLQEIYNAKVSIFQKRGAMGILSSDNVDLPIQNAKELQAKYFENYGLHANKSSILITTASTKYQRMSMDISEMQILENKKADIETLCNVFNYPIPLLINDASTYNNLEIARKNLYTQAVIPMCNSLAKTLTNSFNLKGYEFKADTSKIQELQESKEDKINLMFDAFTNGIITRNETREAIGMEKVKDGDKYIFDYQNNTQDVKI